MGNLKEIRTRISSISKSMQITSAMKMVSAARLKKSQQRIEKMRPYAEKMGDLISDLSVNSENKNGLTEEREQKKTLFLFLSSNKGLCGSITTSLVKHLEELCKKDFSQTQSEVFCLGKKAEPILKRKGFSIVSVNTDIIEKPNFKETGMVSGKIMADFLAQKYDIYTQTLGTVTDTGILKINDLVDLGRDDINKAYFESLSNIME